MFLTGHESEEGANFSTLMLDYILVTAYNYSHYYVTPTIYQMLYSFK